MIPTYIERMTTSGLCQNANPISRERAEELKLKSDAYDYFVPPCVYQCGCPNDESCGYFQEFLNYAISRSIFDITNIKERYRLYNDFFKMKKGLPVKHAEKEVTISKPHAHLLGTMTDAVTIDDGWMKEPEAKPNIPSHPHANSGRYPWGHDWSAWNNEEDQNGE